MNDRKMGNIGTMSQSNPVTTHGIFNNTIFETFSDTEAKLYEMLLDYIGFWTIESDKVSGMANKNDGWGIVEESKRQEIFDLFSKAVRDNREKWKLSEDDLNTVYNNMFDEKLNKIISIKEYLIELGMPDVWIKIIEERLDNLIRVAASNIGKESMRYSYSVNGFVVFTGEYALKNPSTNNRIVLLEVFKDELNKDNLRKVEHNPSRLSVFYFWFIQWVVSNYAE